MCKYEKLRDWCVWLCPLIYELAFFFFLFLVSPLPTLTDSSLYFCIFPTASDWTRCEEIYMRHSIISAFLVEINASWQQMGQWVSSPSPPSTVTLRALLAWARKRITMKGFENPQGARLQDA